MTLTLSLLSILQGNEWLLRTCSVGTYDWMKDETADYKAVKENAKNSQSTQKCRNKIVVPNWHMNCSRDTISIFIHVLEGHVNALFAYHFFIVRINLGPE